MSDGREGRLREGSRTALLLLFLLLTTLLVRIVRFETAAEGEAPKWESGVGEEEESVEVCGGAGYVVCGMSTGGRSVTLCFHKCAGR